MFNSRIEERKGGTPPLKAFTLLFCSFLFSNPVLIIFLGGSLPVAFGLPVAFFLFLLFTDRFASKRCPWLLAYSLNILILLGICIYGEVLFRGIAPQYNIKDLYTLRPGYQFNKPNLNEMLLDRESASFYATNAQGFRLPAGLASDKRIHKCDWLFIGDSFSQGAQVEYEYLYTSVLQKYFPDKIILNASVSGIGIPEQYEMAKDFIDRHAPSALFLQVSAFNDFVNVVPGKTSLIKYLLHHSSLARFLFYDAAFTRREDLPLRRWAEPFHLTEEGNSNYNVFFTQDGRQKREDLKNYKNYLYKIIELCRGKGTKLIVLLVPSKEQVDSRYLDEVVYEFRIDTSKLDMDRPNKLLREWLKGEEALLIDPTGRFRNSAVPLFFDIDEHLNIEGHSLLAEAITSALQASGSNLSPTQGVTPLFSAARYPSFSGDGSVMSYQKNGNGREVVVLTSPTNDSERIIDMGVKATHPVLSGDGRYLMFTQGEAESKSTKIILLDLATGKKTYLTDEINEFGAIPQFNREGTKAAYASWFYDQDNQAYTVPRIVIRDLLTSGKKYISFGSGECWRPVFSPDGNSLVYISKREGNFDIYSFDLNNETETNLTKTPYDEWDPSFSRSGKKLAYAASKDGNWDLFIMNVLSGETKQLTRTSGDEWDPAFSPDERYIYFAGEFGFSGGVYRKPLLSPAGLN